MVGDRQVEDLGAYRPLHRGETLSEIITIAEVNTALECLTDGGYIVLDRPHGWHQDRSLSVTAQALRGGQAATGLVLVREVLRAQDPCHGVY